jgi:hypothetical protein
MIAAFNAGLSWVRLKLPQGKWGVCVNETKAGTEILEILEDHAWIKGISPMILVKVE